MAKNEIAQYFKKNDGSQISSDSAFATLQGNEKIINKNSGEKYSKNPSYPNVFDKTDTFTDLEKMLKANAVKRIENTNDPDGTTNYYSIDGTKLGSFKGGVSPNELNAGLNNVRSASISSIDDANGNGICSCKNSSGTQIDTFKCHVPVSNSAPTLSWGQTSTVGSVDGTSLTVKMPSDPTANFPEIWIG
jgi:hypothetical protein